MVTMPTPSSVPGDATPSADAVPRKGLLVVGIDGATFDIMNPMLERGELPHIAAILKNGASGALESTIPPLTPPAWTSMMTGLNPGAHGIFHFIRRQAGSYQMELATSESFAGYDIFSALGRRGWTTGGFSVPMTYPPFPINGFMVSGIPMPMTGPNRAFPQDWLARLEEHTGQDYQPDIDYAPYGGKSEPKHEDLDRYATLRDDLFRVERERIHAMELSMEMQPTDFFFGVISVTDRCQHYFWKFQDKEHDGWSEEGARRFGSVIEDSYRLADEAVGRLLAVAKKTGYDPTIALVSDHGFGSYSGDFHVNLWLEQQGYLHFHPIPRWVIAKTTVGNLLHHPKAKLVRKLVPKFCHSWVLARPKRKKQRDARDIDWSQTVAFASMYGICLNVKGREAEGIVAPGEERDALVQEIRKGLDQLTDPHDGQPVVAPHYDARELYRGPHVELAPDIQYAVKDLSYLQLEGLSEDELFRRRRFAAVSGTHRMNGLFAVAGSGIKAGYSLTGMHIQDTMPTLLTAVGECVPDYSEGKIWREIFQQNHVEPADLPQEVRLVEKELKESLQSQVGVSDVWGEEEKKKVVDSLTGLGYL